MMRFLTMGVLIVGLAAVLMPSRDAAAQDPMTTQELQAIVDTLFTGDTAAIEELLRFTPVACLTGPIKPGAPPQCREGEPDGTLIEGFPNATCEGGYARPDETQQIVQDLANPDAYVVAIYPWETPTTDVFFYGDYVVVATLNPDFPQFVGGVFIGEGGITGVAYGCAQTADEFAAFWGLDEQVRFNEGLATATPQPTATVAATALPSTGTGTSGGAAGLPAIWLTLAALGALALVSAAVTLLRQAKA
jgi:hypothetical protein